MSYSWFRKMFKKYTGLSPTQYQLQIKVQKAKEFLTSSSLPIKEISDILQFDSVNYFISFFKEKTSESPSEFRKRVHNSSKK
jgi:AraC-like DNA-binding protein